nr:hypothetical protein [Caproiciproducens galactitolivorans]
MVNGFDTGLSTALQTNLRLPPSAPLDSAADRKERQLKSHSAHHAKYDLLSQIRRRRPYVHYKQAVHKYPNLLQRIFEQSLPNHFWVTDITYIPTVKGMLYLCAVVNLCGKMVLAYRIGVMI